MRWHVKNPTDKISSYQPTQDRHHLKTNVMNETNAIV